MAKATADEILLGLINEVTYGTDPGTTRQLLRITGESLEAVEKSVLSAEITGDRQVADVVRTDFGIQGALNFELSAVGFDDLLEGFLLNSAIGDNGNTLRSFTLERQYSDLSSLSAIFKGCMVNGLNLNVAVGAIVSGSFDILGKTEVAGTGMTTPTAAPTSKVINAIGGITAITEGGSAIELLEWAMTGNNNLRGRPLLGTLGPQSMAAGRLEIGGTMKAYFETATLYNKFLNETESSLSISLEDSAGAGYSFTFPRVRYTKAKRVAGGINSDIVVEMGWQALRKATSAFNTIAIANLT